MDKTVYEKLFNDMMNGTYFSARELQYDNNANVFLSAFDYQNFLAYKDELIEQGHEMIAKLNLKSFNGGYIHFVFANELMSKEGEYYKLINEDFDVHKETLYFRNMDSMTRSRIYSELEGSLNIEAVQTTRRAVEELSSGKRDPKTKNEHIIKNMAKGIEFLATVPEFNEANLFNLYSILTENCLDPEDELPEGAFYRNDSVEVGRYKGCPESKIKECMDSLFEFVNENLKDDGEYKRYLPHIAHYYLVYVHPYFDYNGRTARMVSYWLSMLTNRHILPPVVSEAINQTKGKYYYSLEETRDSHNDLTYFLLYIYDVSIKYFLTYKNVEEISDTLKNKAILLSDLEKNYIKKILISNKGKFTHQDFESWINVEMTKQGALKILNHFAECGVLNVIENASNKKLYELNSSMIRYKTN